MSLYDILPADRCTSKDCEFACWPHVHDFKNIEPTQLAIHYIATGGDKHQAYTPYCYNCGTRPEYIILYGCSFGRSDTMMQKLVYCPDHFDSGQRKLVQPFLNTERLLELLDDAENILLLGGILETKEGKDGFRLACKQIKEQLTDPNGYTNKHPSNFRF